jgi:hypothetical protein
MQKWIFSSDSSDSTSLSISLLRETADFSCLSILLSQLSLQSRFVTEERKTKSMEVHPSHFTCKPPPSHFSGYK